MPPFISFGFIISSHLEITINNFYSLLTIADIDLYYSDFFYFRHVIAVFFLLCISAYYNLSQYYAYSIKIEFLTYYMDFKI